MTDEDHKSEFVHRNDTPYLPLRRSDGVSIVRVWVGNWLRCSSTTLNWPIKTVTNAWACPITRLMCPIWQGQLGHTRWPCDSLLSRLWALFPGIGIFIMGISILLRRHIYIDTASYFCEVMIGLKMVQWVDRWWPSSVKVCFTNWPIDIAFWNVSIYRWQCQEICTWFACYCILLWSSNGGFYPYSSGLLLWHRATNITVLVPVMYDIWWKSTENC